MSVDQGWDTERLGLRRAPRIKILPHLGTLRQHPGVFFESIRQRVPNGEIHQIRLGPIRAVLLTNPDHVKRVFVTERSRYERDGMMWEPLTRLNGTGMTGHGEPWRRHRSIMAPMFSRAGIERLVGVMAPAIDEAVADLERRAAGGVVLDGMREMTRIVHTSLIRAFFGDRIALDDAERLGRGIATAFGALGARLLMPFMPNRFPMPGDRRFMRAVTDIDAVMLPLVRQSMAGATDADDVMSWLVRASGKLSEPLTEREIRDDVVTLFVGGTETTALALTWLWATLEQHAEAAHALRTETRQVVGSAVPGPEHLPQLDYTRRSLMEILRLYPGGWILPRTTVAHDTIDGVQLRPGDIALASPYLTHRLEYLWPDPDRFNPDRFLDQAVNERHRYAYLPFGAGEHRCLGEHLYLLEAQLIVARLLRNHTPRVDNPDRLAPRAELTLRPREPVQLRLET